MLVVTGEKGNGIIIYIKKRQFFYYKYCKESIYKYENQLQFNIIVLFLVFSGYNHLLLLI